MLVGFAVVLLFFSGATLPAQQAAKKEIKGTGWGSLKGKVTYAGQNPPALANLQAVMAAHQDKACCLAPNATAEETTDPSWIIDPKTKGVKNVVVWLKAGVGEYFEIQKKDQVRNKPVEIDQPHCAFIPHVTVVYPEFFDGKKSVPTGETLIVKNSAPVPHNSNFTSPDPVANPGGNNFIPPGGQQLVKVNPMRLPFNLQCNIHGWMSAYVFVFDHPYYAITKDDGTYVIPDVPAGVQVNLMGWHEAVGYASDAKGQPLTNKGRAITFNAGANTFDMTVAP